MGREIVYCEGCGERILEADFEKGHAVTILNKKFCAKCKSSHEVASGSSPVLKSVGSGSPTKLRTAPATHRPSGPGTDRKTLPPKKDSRIPLVLGAGVGVTALGLLVWLMLADPNPKDGTTPPTPNETKSARPTESPDRKIAEAIRKLEDMAAMAISTPEQIIAECNKVRPLVLGTRHAARVDQVEAAATQILNEKTRLANYESGMKEIRLLRASDPNFEKVDAAYKLVEDLKQIAAKFTAEQKLEIEKEEIDLTNAFNKYAQEQSEALIAMADSYGKSGRVEDAIKTLEAYPAHLRKTAHWEPVERRIRHYKTAPPPVPTPQATTAPRLPEVPTHDMPPMGKPFILFDGKNIDNFHRLMLAKENSESWKIVDGVLVGESSFKVDDVPRSFYDPLLTKAAGFENFELEFETKVDVGEMGLYSRFDSTKNQFASAARIQAENTKDWNKFKAKWSGGKYTIERVGNPPVAMTINPGIDKGRFVFCLSPGAKASLRNIKITPLKE